MKIIKYMKYVSFVLLLVFALFLIHCSGGGGGEGGNNDSGGSDDDSYGQCFNGIVHDYKGLPMGYMPIEGAVVTFTDMEGKELMRKTTDKSGNFWFCPPEDYILKKDTDGVLKVEKAGYRTYTNNLTLQKKLPMEFSLVVYLVTHDVVGDAHSADGTWTYNAGTNVLTINWTRSDFPCHGPSVGTETKTVTITDTQMTWPGEMTWSHSEYSAPGQADDPNGHWESTTAAGTYYLDISVDWEHGPDSGQIMMRGLTSACNL